MKPTPVRTAACAVVVGKGSTEAAFRASNRARRTQLRPPAGHAPAEHMAASAAVRARGWRPSVPRSRLPRTTGDKHTRTHQFTRHAVQKRSLVFRSKDGSGARGEGGGAAYEAGGEAAARGGVRQRRALGAGRGAGAGRHTRLLSPRAAATAAATPMRRHAREEQRGVPARLAVQEGGMPTAFELLAAGLVAHEPLGMRRSPSGTSEICVSTSAPVEGARALGHGTLQWACEGKL